MVKSILLRSKHVLIVLTLLVVTNPFHKILLHHIKVIFTTFETNHRNLIIPLPSLFLHLAWKHLKYEGYGCCFKASAAMASCFPVRSSMNRLIKRFEFLSIKYAGSLLNVSWTATLIGICLDKYVRLSVGC